eukprot:COSAG02_NODE_3655_length_6410_cov_3.941531_2_plen_1669_part_00
MAVPEGFAPGDELEVWVPDEDSEEDPPPPFDLDDFEQLEHEAKVPDEEYGYVPEPLLPQPPAQEQRSDRAPQPEPEPEAEPASAPAPAPEPAPAPFVPSVHLQHSSESGEASTLQQETGSGVTAHAVAAIAEVPTASASFTPPASPAKDRGVVAQEPSSLPHAKLLPLQELLDAGTITLNVFENAMQKLVDAETTVSAAADSSVQTANVFCTPAAENLEVLPVEARSALVEWEERADNGWLPCDASTSDFLEVEYATRKRAWEAYDDASRAMLEKEFMASLGARRVTVETATAVVETGNEGIPGPVQALVEASEPAAATQKPHSRNTKSKRVHTSNEMRTASMRSKRPSRKPALPIVAIRKANAEPVPESEPKLAGKLNPNSSATRSIGRLSRKLHAAPSEVLEKQLYDAIVQKATLRKQSAVRFARSEFERFDANGNGTLDEHEFRETLRSLGLVMNGSEISQLMKHLDDDDDGAVSLAELDARLWNTRVKALKRRLRSAAYSGGKLDLHKLFRHYDRDNSGEIEFKEFALAVRRDAKLKLTEVSEVELREIFEHIDADNSGSISVDEFVQLLDPGSADVEASQERFNSMAGCVCDRILRRADEMNMGQQKQLIYLFNRYANESGQLTRKLFRKALMELGVTLSKQEMTAVLKDLDTDGDGEISSTEFLARLRLAKTDAHMQGVGIHNSFLLDESGEAEQSFVEHADPLPSATVSLSPTGRRVGIRHSPFKQRSGKRAQRKAALPSVKNKSQGIQIAETPKSKKARSPKTSPSPRSTTPAEVLEKQLYDAIVQKAALRKQSAVRFARSEFERFDANGNGTLDEHEFRETLRSLGLVMNGSEISQLMKHLDDDDDGAVSLAELDARLWNTRVKALKRQLRSAAYSGGKLDLHKLFRHYDRDNSGEIEFKEFALAVRRDAKLKLTEVSEVELREIFEHIDADNSGSISVDEFVQLLDPGSADVEASQERFNSMAGCVCDRILRRADEMNMGQQKQLIYLFNRYANESGQLTRKLFRKALMELGVTLSKQEMTAVLKDLDTDGDGEISSTEFLARLRLAKTDAHMQGVGIQRNAVQQPIVESQPESGRELEPAPEPELFQKPKLEVKPQPQANDNQVLTVQSTPQKVAVISRAVQRLVVVRPDGSVPGDALLVQTPAGETIAVTVPEDVKAGDEFEVEAQSPLDSHETGSSAGRLPTADIVVPADNDGNAPPSHSAQAAWMQETVAELEQMLNRREAELARREKALDQRTLAIELREKVTSEAHEQHRALHARESAALAAQVTALAARELALQNAEGALQVRQEAVGEIASLHEQLHFQQRAAVTASSLDQRSPQPEEDNKAERREDAFGPTIEIDNPQVQVAQQGDESTMADVLGTIMALEVGLQSPGSVYRDPTMLQAQQHEQQRDKRKAKRTAGGQQKQSPSVEIVRHRSCTLGRAEDGFEANAVPPNPNKKPDSTPDSSPAWKRIQAKRETERRAEEAAEEAAENSEHNVKIAKQMRAPTLRVGKSWRPDSTGPSIDASAEEVAAAARQERIRKYERDAILDTLRTAMRARRTIFGHTVQSPQELFAALDRDNSGSVSIGELVNALKRLGVGLSQEQVERLATFIGVSPHGQLDFDKITTLLGEAKNDAGAKANESSSAASGAAPNKPPPPTAAPPKADTCIDDLV